MKNKHGTSLLFPTADAFHQAGAAIRVPQRQVIDQAFAADPNAMLFEPPDPADVDTDVVRVRRVMLLPFCYVRLLLAGSLSPCDAWLQIAGAVYNDN